MILSASNCACYCKDTHFEAIHNFAGRRNDDLYIVLATAKIHILKQFTTERRCVGADEDCACYCKDTHFEAIHNTPEQMDDIRKIVLATAKIHILKQFTTRQRGEPQAHGLCLLLQRYTF